MRIRSLAVGLFLVGCAGKSGQNADLGRAGSGGAAGSSGAAASSAGASGSAGLGGVGGAETACIGPAPAALPATGRVELPVRVTINGATAVIGTPGVGRTGREFKLSLFKFFLSEPHFVTADGREAEAQFLNPEGAPAPYELHLVDAEEPATQVLRLATEPGSYTALRFGVGVPAACNGMSNTSQVFPLNPDSDMFWPWGSQFMFIRIEGTSRGSATEAWAPFTYHVGFQPAFTNLTVPGPITVGSGGNGPTLSLDIDLMLQVDADGLPSAQHSVPEGWVVDNLETNQAFTLQ